MGGDRGAPMDGLIGALSRETEARVEAIRAAGQAAVAERRARAEAERAQRRSAAIDALRDRVARELAGERAAAEAEARRVLLSARHRLLERVERAALAALPTPDAGWIGAAIAQALRVLPPGPVQVRCRPGTPGPWPDGWTPSVDLQAPAGFVAIAGDLTVDATLSTVLQRLRPALARETLEGA